jgi:potassium efflux system protein
MLVVRSAIRTFTLVLATCSLAMPADAQPLLRFPTIGESPEQEAPPDVPIAKKRAENAELLRVAQRKLDAASPTDPAAAQDVALFKTVEAVLAQQEAVQTQIADLKARQESLQTDLQSLRTKGVDLSTQCAFPQFDQLKDELAAEQARKAVAADRAGIATADLERSTRLLDELQRKDRLAREALDTAAEGTDTTELAAAAEQAVQAVKLAEETVSLRKLELSRDELSRDVQQLAVQVLEEKVARIKPLVSFSKADLKQQLAEIKRQDAEIAQTLRRAEQRRAEAQSEWASAKRQLKENTADPAVLTEKLEACRRADEKLQNEVEFLNGRRQQLEQLRVVWKRRYQIATTPPDKVEADQAKYADEWRKWRKVAGSVLEELDDETRAQIQRLDLVRKDIATVAKKLDAAKEGPPEAASWIERQRAYLEELLRLHEAHLVALETSRRLHEKLLAEAGEPFQTISPTRWLRSAGETVSDAWNYELYSNKDAQGTVVVLLTVRKVVTGLLLFVAGLIVARILASLVAHRLLRRFRLSKDAQAAIKTLVFYILLVIVVVWALRWLNVPLTAFTILGGALAIGVGFGSQAIINNFLSGLIMLAERPVRLGERIVFGKYDGTVEEVGFRSTKLRTLTDHLVTIPNSSLINESIENIGRRRTIRRLLNVTITYDTPREKVLAAVQAIRDVLAEKGIREPIHPIVGFEEFPPHVHFNDYNAESLNIEVVYWYAPPDWWAYMQHTEQVNIRIMEEFGRLGVEFAFPSRTLYLAGDAKREVAVRLLGNQANQDEAGPYG